MLTAPALYSDLLRRHAAGHGDNDSTPKRGKRTPLPDRVSLACTACATAKVRCNEGKPCSRCHQRGLVCENLAAGNVSQEQARATAPVRSVRSHMVGPISESGYNVAAADLNSSNVAQGQPSQTASNGRIDMFQQVIPPCEVNAMPQALPNPFAAPTRVANETSTPPQILLDAPSSLQDLVVPREEVNSMLYDPWSTHDQSFGDFLADIMVQPLETQDLTNSSVDAPERDVLDFGADNALDFHYFEQYMHDTGHAPSQHQPRKQRSGSSSPPSLSDEDHSSAFHGRASDAFSRSLWHFVPNQLDRVELEQMMVPVSTEVTLSSHAGQRLSEERLDQTTRDEVMAMVMGACEPQDIQHIVRYFPSAGVLDGLIHEFLSYEDGRATSPIHMPTFRMKDARPEMIAIYAASGAIRHESCVVRKLGYALQENVRMVLPKIVGCHHEVALVRSSLTGSVEQGQPADSKSAAAPQLSCKPRHRRLEWRSPEDGNLRERTFAPRHGKARRLSPQDID